MVKGKNFSMNNLGQRNKSDFYETPYSMTKQFLDAESVPSYYNILEPAAGNGAIVSVLEEKGFSVTGKTLENGEDFLKETGKYDAIITNPPFSLAKEFIVKAKEVSSYFAMLLPLSYLHGKERYDTIYTDKTFPLARIYVFTRYPMLGEELREDGKYNTGMMVYAWFVWDKTHTGPAEINWIDNNDFILKKGRK